MRAGQPRRHGALVAKTLRSSLPGETFGVTWGKLLGVGHRSKLPGATVADAGWATTKRSELPGETALSGAPFKVTRSDGR
jgi:hypothetical protein